MILSANELIDLYEGAYDLEKEALTINKSVAAMLGGYAESNDLSKTAIKKAYKAFKDFKEGKVSTQDDDYFTLQAIVEEHFSGDGKSEDTVAG